jgi:thioredoxin:protein disulfide reductase
MQRSIAAKAGAGPGLRRVRWLAVPMMLFVAALSAHGAQDSALSRWLGQQPEFLPVHEAFRLTTELAPDGAVLARWEMPKGYYLYRHAFAFTTRTVEGGAAVAVVLGEAEIPPGEPKVDEYFGAVEVYYGSARARIPVASGSGLVEVGITYQGCADAGLCYPPETHWVAYNLSPVGGAGAAATVGAGGGGGALAPLVPATTEQTLAAQLRDSGSLAALLLFFLGGLALTFTPCVLPMVPILSSIIVGESGRITRGRAFSLSLAYVIGMAVTYAILGVVVGLFGASLNLQAALQAPAVLVFFALVFGLLALAMFGFYELRLPQAWQNGLNGLGDRIGGGKHLGVVVMGSLSALVVSPCISAPLAGALIYLSTTGDAFLGGAALLMLGLGMGVPLLVIGASGAHLLPRAGPWMNAVKAVFGVGLLAVAIWLLERVVAPGLALALWAALAIGCGVYLGALDFAPRRGWGQLWKATGAFSFIYGVLLLIGAASGAHDPLKPLGGFGAAMVAGPAGAQEANPWRPVRGLSQLEAELERARQAGEPVLLDLYADWCVSCKIMERSVFPRPEVAERLRAFRLLRADVTRNDAQDKALLEAFGLFGPPSLVFFDNAGRELADVRVQGEIGAAGLAAHLQAVLDRERGRAAGNLAAHR